jgi:hypothetical protein
MKSKEISLVLILILITVVIAVTAEGSTWKGRELRAQWEKAAWKWGPFRIQPMIIISDAGYDSNVYYQPNAVKDFWLTTGPALNAYLPIRKKIVFQFSESPQYVFFRKTTRERTWNNYFSGQLHFLFRKFFLSLGGSLNNARERWNTEIDIRPMRKEQSLHGEMLYQRKNKISLSVGIRWFKYDYESVEYAGFNVRELLSRQESYLNPVAYYQLTHRIRAFVEGEYGTFKFQNPLSRRNSDSQALYAGFDFSTAAKIRGKIRLGYKKFNSLDKAMPDYQGLVADTNLSVRLLRNLTVRCVYRRNVQFSIWFDNTFYLENWGGGGASLYFFRRKIRLDYDYNLGLNTYPATQLSGSSIKREDKYTVHSVGLYFRIKKDVGVGVMAGRWERSINFYGWNAKREFVGLNLTYDF